MGGGTRLWERWFKDDVVTGMLYMTICTAVQVDLYGTLSPSKDGKTTKSVPRRDKAKKECPRREFCSLRKEDDELFLGVLGFTALYNFHQFKFSIFTDYFSDFIYCWAQ